MSNDHIYIESDIFDNVTINGKISKKLCQKVFVSRINYLQKQLELSQKREAILKDNCNVILKMTFVDYETVMEFREDLHGYINKALKEVEEMV